MAQHVMAATLAARATTDEAIATRQVTSRAISGEGATPMRDQTNGCCNTCRRKAHHKDHTQISRKDEARVDVETGRHKKRGRVANTTTQASIENT